MTARWQRLRLPWILAPLFFVLSDPTSLLLLAGSLVSASGLALRGAAAGRIRKDEDLAITGPYAHLRHPLYVGSFFLGLGVMIGGGRLLFVVLYVPSFLWLYRRTIQAEERLLERLFGEAYRVYRARVPAVLPRAKAYISQPADEMVDGPVSVRSGFRMALYRRNKEWQALAGALGTFALLWLKARS